LEGEEFHLCGDVEGAVGDVEVSNDEDEAGCHGGCGVVVEVLGNVRARALARKGSCASNSVGCSFSFLNGGVEGFPAQSRKC
jgi:hypothetical protein